MTRQPWYVALALIALVTPPAAAQESLTLDRAVEATLSSNPSLDAARTTTAEAQAREAEARSGFFPRVSVSESWQRGDQPVFVFSSLLAARKFAAENLALDALNHPDPVGFSRLTLGIEQLVFDGGRQRSQAGAATLRRQMAERTADQTAAALALAATQTFGRILLAQSVMDAARASVASGREDLTRAERRRDAGLATDADVLAIQVHVADLEQRAIRADGDAAIARAELNRLMGTAAGAAFRAVEATTDESQAAGPDITALLAEAEAARPELRRAEAAEQLADRERRVARSALLPQIAAQAAFEVSGVRFNDRASSWLAGAELRWTFSTGGAELARLRAAAHARDRARAEREDARAAVHVEIISAVAALEAARARQAAGRAAVSGARESLRVIRDRFDAGLAGVNDVLRASTAMLDAEASRVSAVVDHLVSQAMLRRAVGRAP